MSKKPITLSASIYMVLTDTLHHKFLCIPVAVVFLLVQHSDITLEKEVNVRDIYLNICTDRSRIFAITTNLGRDINSTVTYLRKENTWLFPSFLQTQSTEQKFMDLTQQLVQRSPSPPSVTNWNGFDIQQTPFLALVFSGLWYEIWRGLNLEAHHSNVDAQSAEAKCRMFVITGERAKNI